MSLLITKKIPNGIFHIKLNRPNKLNALSLNMLKELSEVFTECKHDPEIRSVLISGEGKIFSAGADLEELNSLIAYDHSRFGQRVFNQLENLGKPSICAVHGGAHGGGCEFISASTFRIATMDTVFSQPEIKRAIIPAFGGTQRLKQLIGKGRALALCLSGGTFNADQAVRWGFLGQTTTNEDLIPKAIGILERLNELSPAAIESILHLFNSDVSFEHGLKLESIHFHRRMQDECAQNSIKKFLERKTNKE